MSSGCWEACARASPIVVATLLHACSISQPPPPPPHPYPPPLPLLLLFFFSEATAQLKGQVLPVPRNLPSLTYGSVSQTLAAAPGGLKAADGSALYKSNFEALRKERANARLVGIREKKAMEAAAKDAAAAKKAGKAGDAEEA